uniref:acetate--CoA ligase n=1 Tax=Ciona savignyi TaxID=51511 RepID=H2YFH8_CIOSA
FKGVNTYEDLYHFSINNSDKFWGELAKSRLDWIKPFGKVSDCDMHTAKFRWFEGGKLNVSVNCVDRHAAVHPDRVALIWEKDELGTSEKVTYSQLLIMVCKLANCLKERGIARGDRVAIYMPVSPIAVAAMLACARIGAVHSVVFAGFSAEALAQRIQDGMVETVITTDQGVRGGKVIELKQTVDNAVEKCPSVKRVPCIKFVVKQKIIDRATPNRLANLTNTENNVLRHFLQGSSYCRLNANTTQDKLDTTMEILKDGPKLLITAALADRKPVHLHLFRNYDLTDQISSDTKANGLKSFGCGFINQLNDLTSCPRCETMGADYFRLNPSMEQDIQLNETNNE